MPFSQLKKGKKKRYQITISLQDIVKYVYSISVKGDEINVIQSWSELCVYRNATVYTMQKYSIIHYIHLCIWRGVCSSVQLLVNIIWYVRDKLGCKHSKDWGNAFNWGLTHTYSVQFVHFFYVYIHSSHTLYLARWYLVLQRI